MLRPKLNRIWANASTNTRRDPGDAKYIQGWIAEIPTFQVLNYLQYKTDITLLALAERGVFEWGNDIQYGLGSLVWDETNKTIYVSTVGNPSKTLVPSANPSQWASSSIQVSRASYDAIVAAINAHIADVTGNPHKLTAGRLNAYNKNEIDNIVNAYRALVQAHSDDKNNPHQVTATQTGAVPSTGGTYTGDVTFAAGMFFDVGKTSGIDKTGGLWLKNNNGMLGISDAGVGQVGTVGSMSNIVTEDTYPGLKEIQEPSYTVPAPAVRFNFIGDINMTHGFGVFDTNFVPAYSPTTNALIMTTGTVAQVGNGYSIIGEGGNNFTVCYDAYAENGRVPSDGANAFLFGMDDSSGSGMYLFITGASTIWATRKLGTVTESASFQLVGPTQTWYRLAATFKGNEIRLFINGVQVAANLTATATAAAVGSPIVITSAARGSGVPSRTIGVRNARIWTQALTDKQVSNL